MRGNELYHTYHMRRKAGLSVPVAYNTRLSGASLFGRVLNAPGKSDDTADGG